MEEETHSNSSNLKKQNYTKREGPLHTSSTKLNLVAHGCQDKDKMAAIPAASATWLSTNSFHPPQAQDTGKQ